LGFSILAVLTLSSALLGQTSEVLRHNIENWALQGRGVPEDWSHHHLIFSNPGTEEDAIANGTHRVELKGCGSPQLHRDPRAVKTSCARKNFLPCGKG
jgi:hypothetical protein